MRTVKVSVAAAVPIVMTLLVPAMAHASVSKSGTKNCTANQTGVSRAYSTGTTEHYPPDTGYGIFYNGGTWKATSKNATSGGAGSGSFKPMVRLTTLEPTPTALTERLRWHNTLGPSR